MTKELKDCEVVGCGKKGIKNIGVHMRIHKGAKPSGVSSEAASGLDSLDKESIDAKMDAMIAGLNSVTGAVLKLVEMQTSDTMKEKPEVKETFTPKLEDETYPTSYTPPRFRKLCDEILSSEFGLSVTDFPDRTDFQLSITVPEKFSSVPPTERQKGVQDVRSRMIPRALGENGVKEWCGLIRKNLNRHYQKEGIVTPFNTMTE